jgi:hypothetical protein
MQKPPVPTIGLGGAFLRPAEGLSPARLKSSKRAYGIIKAPWVEAGATLPARLGTLPPLIGRKNKEPKTR